MVKQWFVKTIEKIWKTKQPKLIFWLLCFFERIYSALFKVDQDLKKQRAPFVSTSLRVISIGNLSVGGTGKSVVTRYLVERIGAQHCVILAHGYGGNLEQNFGSHIVSLGNGLIIGSVDEVGDEPFMLAKALPQASVIVGRKRLASIKLAETINQQRSCCNKLQYIILDDGYQNHELKKDIEILLLDARAPFGNNHCLPAGPLREKDYDRADLIILTHADAIAPASTGLLKNMLSEISGKPVFAAAHRVRGVYTSKGQILPLKELLDYTFSPVAGLGSFDGFLQTVASLGCQIGPVHQFPDHHHYTDRDIARIYAGTAGKATALLTTEKDWPKVSKILEGTHKELAKELPWFTLGIGLQFLTPGEEEAFFAVVKERLKL